MFGRGWLGAGAYGPTGGVGGVGSAAERDRLGVYGVSQVHYLFICTCSRRLHPWVAVWWVDAQVPWSRADRNGGLGQVLGVGNR